MKHVLVAFIFFVTLPLSGQEFQLKRINGPDVSFRGLSVVDDAVAWVSGNKGYFGRTVDGGITWKFTQLKDFSELDFRSIYAFNEKDAVIVNAGSPATVLVTKDGGQNWLKTYSNNDKDVFVDGIDFWNDNEGIIYGDPIVGKMFLLQTKDGGSSWTNLETTPSLEAGEASFAASGTGIRCLNQQDVVICTGGKVSRLWTSNDKGMHWRSLDTPILQGEQTTGIFSFIENDSRWFIVGGDYKNESQRLKHVFYSDDHGHTWSEPISPTNGYRECITVIGKNKLLAAGPSGLDQSDDNGLTWKIFPTITGLHVVRRSRHGSLIVGAGGKGQIVVILNKD